MMRAPAFVALLLIIGSAASAAEGPALIEAEQTGAGIIIDEAGCSGARAVTAKQAWEPLLRMAAPPADMTEVSLWIRQRGGPVQVKGLVGNTQQAFAWQWAQPTAWEWRECGPFPRAAVADGAVVIRGDVQEGADPAIDAAVWLAAGSPAPEDLTPALDVTVAIAWATKIASTTGFSFGINAFRGFDPLTTALPAYQDGMHALGCGLVRLHSAELFSGKGPNTWIDAEQQTWLTERVRAAVAAYPRQNLALMLNISNWPAWFDADDDGFLDVGQFDAYADFCAELVRLVNIEAQGEVLWWEITNELDDRYHNHLIVKGLPSRMPELCDFWLRAAVAMKKVDPRIRTGGPALIRPDLTASLRLFLQGTQAELDFVTYHAYASGSAADANAHILGPRIEAITQAVASIDALIPAELGRDLPHFLDEYNISWTWETRDSRMTDHKGAVFDALVLAASATAGADGTCAWNEWDGVYGKFSGNGTPRPQVGVFARLNAWGRGAVVRSVVTGAPESANVPAAVVAFAVVGAQGRLLMLVNRSNAPVQVQGLADLSSAQIDRVDAVGAGPVEQDPARLPRYSVTFYRWATP